MQEAEEHFGEVCIAVLVWTHVGLVYPISSSVTSLVEMRAPILKNEILAEPRVSGV